ncbi:MAG: 8-amino-7-oxononanoate synthase [Bacteroidota bacterium]|nr:8-amino-7-oxononanoate synthase [Bacteroidota bacterium]
MNEDFLEKKLVQRREENAFRLLVRSDGKIDFCSNDYLGIVKNELIEKSTTEQLPHGSTGSRLLSGNYDLAEETENFIADFHEAEAGLIFNSGYDANIGLLASIPQKGDVIIYDQLSHASIRDGIRLSFASSFAFIHNNVEDLEKKLSASIGLYKNIFVVTESVFSMDGDLAPLVEISALCEKYSAGLIVDEAHATGVIGEKGAGLVQHLNLQKKCFARVHTFGKAVGCHGALILGSANLKNYLINFARPFIYSTSLPPSAISAILKSYKIFPFLVEERDHLHKLIGRFQKAISKYFILKSETPIQAVIIPGNAEVKKIAGILQENNFDVRPILYPTVPKGKERLRIVFHEFNTIDQLDKLMILIK